MKKIVLILGIICIVGFFTSCSSIDYPQPDFTKPNSNVFDVVDMYSVSKDIEDNVRLVNRTSKTGIAFKVSLHDPKNFVWIEFGVGELKGPGDMAFISSKLSGRLDNYRYAAIESMDGSEYRYSYYEINSDLYITITDK
jgi:hypothetical protein